MRANGSANSIKEHVSGRASGAVGAVCAVIASSWASEALSCAQTGKSSHRTSGKAITEVEIVSTGTSVTGGLLAVQAISRATLADLYGSLCKIAYRTDIHASLSQQEEASLALIAVIGSILTGNTARVTGLAGKDIGISAIGASAHARGSVISTRQQERRSALEAI